MDDKAMFTVYFAGLMAMQYHPRNDWISVPVDERALVMHELADVAKEMVLLTHRIVLEG